MRDCIKTRKKIKHKKFTRTKKIWKKEDKSKVKGSTKENCKRWNLLIITVILTQYVCK